jgi:hypothetical protein
VRSGALGGKSDINVVCYRPTKYRYFYNHFLLLFAATHALSPRTVENKRGPQKKTFFVLFFKHLNKTSKKTPSKQSAIALGGAKIGFCGLFSYV